MLFAISKFLSRLLHLTCATYTTGLIVMNYHYDLQDHIKEHSMYKFLSIFTGVGLILSGVFNIFFIKAGKTLLPEHKLWIHFFEVKFCLSLFMTPLISPLLIFIKGQESTEEERDLLKFEIQYYLVIFFVLYSVFIRQFREESCNNFNDDRVMEKMEQLS
jgi:hypothetical protein